MHHISVLKNEVMRYLDIKEGGIYIDATCGDGGHSKEILNKLSLSGKCILIDRDIDAIERCKERLKDLNKQKIFFCENFENLDRILKNLQIEKVDGILFDLGLSTYQIENNTRGFSFSKCGRLDMRMTKDQKLDAHFVVNNYPYSKLYNIISNFGEESFARNITKAIIEKRKKEMIDTTLQLADIIKCAVPKKYLHRKIHPATKTFQAIRIEVNNELSSLQIGLEKGIKLLKKGGVIVVISYHSLEDRIVKNTFLKFAKLQVVEIINKKIIKPTKEEVMSNPKARSAKLRAIKKIIEPKFFTKNFGRL